jgi:hypothetical protein
VPGARTGTDVSSACKLSLPRTSVARASTSPFSAAAVAPTQPGRVELPSLARQLFRGTAELSPPITGQLKFQPGDLGLHGQRILRHRGDDALQCSGVVGQIVGRDRYTPSGSDPQPLERRNHRLSQFAAACRRVKLSRPALAARFVAASAIRSHRAASRVLPGSAPPRPPRCAVIGIGPVPGAWRTDTARRHPTTRA